MIRSRTLVGASVWALAVLALPLSARAQLSTPAASATPPLSVTLPAPLPTLTPTPPPAGVPQSVPTRVIAPPPTPTPIPRATPVASPTPQMTRVRRVPAAPILPTPTPTPAATVTPTAAPTAMPTEAVPAPAVAAPAPLPSPTAGSEPAQVEASWPWLYIGGGAALLTVLAALAWVSRRRGRPDREGWDEAPAEASREPVAPPPLAPAPPITERARLTLHVAPRRAGVNLLTATADLTVTVQNVGTLPARTVAVAATLTSAGVEQDGQIGELFAGPQPRPAVVPFDLAPGERREVRVLATMPRSDIAQITAAGRPMFVPVVALDVRYDSGAGEGQVAQALAIGVERAGAAKLAPFWLDGPPRMFETVAARAHGVAVER